MFATEVQTLEATLDYNVKATGHAWWAPAAGIVFAVMQLMGSDGQLISAHHGATGPAREFEQARVLAGGLLRFQLDVLIGARGDRVARLQALAAANPGIRPWSDDR